MLVLSMNSKRQRRPNVRLGEIGDVSAAFSCGISHKIKENLEQKRWNHDVENPREIEFNYIYGISMQRSSKFVVSNPGMLPMILADMMHNRENRNPNSSKSVFEFASSDENNTTKPKSDFGTVTRKGRLMKRWGWSTRSNNSVFGNSRATPKISNGDGEGYAGDEFVGLTSNVCYDIYTVDRLKNSSVHETLHPRKDGYMKLKNNYNDFWKWDTHNEGEACYSDNGLCIGPKSGCGYGKMGIGGLSILMLNGIDKAAVVASLHLNGRKTDGSVIDMELLELGRDMYISHLQVSSDSSWAVKCATHQCEWLWTSLYLKSRLEELVGGFDRVTFDLASRESIMAADWLANFCVDIGEISLTPSLFPNILSRFVKKDSIGS
ncbi:hypothetical protein HHK36_022693 [Tetracentron sinense]|uniref:Uncharacterized protein n=1 Tax=Tetracentron sinense TaxID=13715 RepID=A0A834YSE7_TETSI|nr:hypothetical protein HHK36_022693 [Tetracentron sinense]